jgi:hypothetical protein
MYTKRQRNKRILVGVFLAARAATLPVGVAPPKHAQMVAGPFPWQRARARNLAAWSSVPGLRCEMHVELRFGLKKRSSLYPTFCSESEAQNIFTTNIIPV